MIIVELSDRWINLAHLAYAEQLRPGVLRVILTVVLPADASAEDESYREVLDLEGDDCRTMRAALHYHRYVPKRQPEPEPEPYTGAEDQTTEPAPEEERPF